MKLNSTMAERLIAIGLVIAGLLFDQWIITCLGIMYFILKIADD